RLPPGSGELDGRTNHYVRTGRTRNGTLDDQEIIVGIHTNHFQRLGGYTNITEVTRHALAFPYATRSLTLTNGTRRTVGQGVTVCCILSAEIVTLDGAGVTFTF